MWEIEARRDLANLVLVNAGIVPFLENHIDIGTLTFPRVASTPGPFAFAQIS